VKISTSFLMALMLSLSVEAETLPRENPVPGGIAIVPVAPETEPAPLVYYEGQRVLLVPHDGGWRAVVGLPLSLSPGRQVIRVSDIGGRQREIPFEVRSKTYAEQRLFIKDRRMVEPSAEDLMRIEREQEIIRAAFTVWSDLPLKSLQFQLPVQGRISSIFGLRRFFNNKPRQPHSGIDIAAPTGAPVVAPLAGIVVESGDYFFNGKTIFLDHGQGLVSMFNHLSRILVERGKRVGTGEKIGEIGMTGRVTGPHLHWTVSLNNSRVDPELFLPSN